MIVSNNVKHHIGWMRKHKLSMCTMDGKANAVSIFPMIKRKTTDNEWYNLKMNLLHHIPFTCEIQMEQLRWDVPWFHHHHHRRRRLSLFFFTQCFTCLSFFYSFTFTKLSPEIRKAWKKLQSISRRIFLIIRQEEKTKQVQRRKKTERKWNNR